jgi:exodeoxyribonuclease V gamma subunit
LRALLQQRLGIHLGTGAEQLPQDEPFGSDDALRRYQLKQRLFAQLVASDELAPVEDLSDRLLAQGWIAPAAAGVAETRALRNQLLAARLHWREWARGCAEEKPLELALDGLHLSATLGPIHEVGLLQFRAGKGHGRTRIDLALERLLWSAVGETRSIHRLVLEQGVAVIPPLEPDIARAALQRLLTLRNQLLAQALPLMPDSAWAYAEKIYQGESDERAFAAARSSWSNGPQAEGRDPWVRLALRDADPFESPDAAAARQFRVLAMALFDALHEAGVQSHAIR